MRTIVTDLIDRSSSQPVEVRLPPLMTEAIIPLVDTHDLLSLFGARDQNVRRLSR